MEDDSSSVGTNILLENAADSGDSSYLIQETYIVGDGVTDKKSQNEFTIGTGTTFWKYQVNYIPITNTNLNQQPVNAELISENEWFAHLSFEYRLHAKSKPFFYKVGYVPLFFDFTPNSKFSKTINYQTSITIGIGWSF